MLARRQRALSCMLGDSNYVKTFLTLGGIAGAILAIAGVYRLIHPSVPSKGVEISEVRLLPGVGPEGGCESQVMIGARIRIDGYQNQPVKLYSRVDDSAASPLPNNGVPCAPPLGAWSDWQFGKDIKPTVQTQTLQVDLPVTVYFRKQNRTIQVKATDANDQVLVTAMSA